MYLLAAHEAREVEFVRDAAFGYQVNHLGHLVAATGHHKAYAVRLAQHARCGFYEILRTFLHRDTAKESNQLVFALRLLEFFRMGKRLYRVVNRAHFARVDTVFLDDRVARQVTYAYDMVCLFHAAFLDGEHRRVHVAATAVEVRRMNVDD